MSLFLITACNRTYEGAEGRIVSPRWPGFFQPNDYCQFTIQTAANTTISLYFNTFRLPNSRNCTDSSLEVSNSFLRTRCTLSGTPLRRLSVRAATCVTAVTICCFGIRTYQVAHIMGNTRLVKGAKNLRNLGNLLIPGKGVL